MSTDQIREVGPDIFRIELPLPTPALKAVNSYVIRREPRSLVIDVGLNKKACLEALNAGLEAIGVRLSQADFFITHCHGDHLSLISRLISPDTRVYLHRLELEALRFFSDLSPVSRHMCNHGFPESRIQSAISRFPTDKTDIEQRAQLDYVHKEDGQRFTIGDTEAVVMLTPGHAPGHTCLYLPDERILFSGDHILGTITPGIQCNTDDANPIAAFLESLSRIRQLDLKVILPGHRDVIETPYARIDELLSHHRRRCDHIRDILGDRKMSAYEVASRMQWDIPTATWDAVPDEQKWHATSEAIAHLRYLEENGRVARQAVDGIVRYANLPAAGQPGKG